MQTSQAGQRSNRRRSPAASTPTPSTAGSVDSDSTLVPPQPAARASQDTAVTVPGARTSSGSTRSSNQRRNVRLPTYHFDLHTRCARSDIIHHPLS